MAAMAWKRASHGCLVVVVVEKSTIAARNGFPVCAGGPFPSCTAIEFLAYFPGCFFARALIGLLMCVDNRTLMRVTK